MLERLCRRTRATSVAAIVALCVAGFSAPTFASLCTSGEGFGTCYRNLQNHSGEFPFAITVAESESRVIVVDLFTGLAYKYAKADIETEPLVFSGPLPSPVLYSGIAYDSDNDQLRWIASSDGGSTFELVTSDLAGSLISQVPIVSPAGGFIGDITYAQPTGTYWGCDLTNDIYFEFGADGVATGNQFLSPAIAFGGEAYGTGITTAIFAGSTVLDIPMGTPSDLRPTTVRRFDTSGVEFGQTYDLDTATTTSQEWITGIAFSLSGADPTPTEFLVDAIENRIYEVPVIETNLRHPIGLSCSVDATNTVTLDWMNSATYNGIRVFRDGQLFATLTATDETFSDNTADEGTHEYQLQIKETAASPWTDSVACEVVLGPGRFLSAALHGGENPFGITVDEANDEVIVVDLDGTIHRYDRTLVPVAAPIPSIFGAGSTISGVATLNGDLYFVDTTTSELVHTTGANPGPVTEIERFMLTSPGLGVVGGLTADTVAGTLWAVDLTGDLYFEIDPLTGLATGNQFEFAAGGGLGGGITAIGDTGLFDITAGGSGSEIADRVVRVDASGNSTDFEYDLVPTTMSGFVNEIAFTPEGFDGELGVYVVGNDTNTIYALTLFSTGAPFVRGDANGDGTVNLIDATFHLQVLFGATSPTVLCADALDVNDSGDFIADGLADVTFTLTYLFMGGPAPAAPFPNCDIDPSEDSIVCDEYNSCP